MYRIMYIIIVVLLLAAPPAAARHAHLEHAHLGGAGRHAVLQGPRARPSGPSRPSGSFRNSTSTFFRASTARPASTAACPAPAPLGIVLDNLVSWRGLDPLEALLLELLEGEGGVVPPRLARDLAPGDLLLVLAVTPAPGPCPALATTLPTPSPS